VTVFKSGDLVMLKSGGPTMTVDTVNTDIFDDSRITGVLCVWFVGEKLERVRFDHRAIESARLKRSSPGRKGAGPEEASGEYKVVLDEMVAALNIPADAGSDAPRESCLKTKVGGGRRTGRCRGPSDQTRPEDQLKVGTLPEEIISGVLSERRR
jgi:uncharacterized protein YodC (DUF2158 family)